MARNQRLGIVPFQDCRHQFPFYSTDSLHDFWSIQGSRLWMSDDAKQLHFQGMGSSCTEGRQAFDPPSSTHFCRPMPSSGIYIQLKGNILKNYTVEPIFNAQSQLGTFNFPLEPLTPPSSNRITPHPSHLQHTSQSPSTTHLSPTSAPKNFTQQMNRSPT